MGTVRFKRDGLFRKQLIVAKEVYFAQNSDKGNFSLYLKTFIGLVLWFLFYYQIVFVTHSTFTPLLFCVGFGLTLPFIGFTTMHDALHGAYSNKKWVNKLMGYTIELMGPFGTTWVLKHSGMHHPNVNISGEDEDIEAGPCLRFSENQKWRWFHRYQHFYAPIFYSLLYLDWVWRTDFKKYFQKRILERKLFLKRSDHVRFWIGKIIHATLMFVIPLQFYSLEKVLFGYIVMCLVCGLTIAIMFQLAHVTEDALFWDSNSVLEISRTELQVLSTCDFGTKDKVLTWLVGGLNLQVIHHLFPDISHVHYVRLQPIVKEICAENAVKYVEYKNLWVAIVSHFRHLKEMGKKPEPNKA